MLNLKINPLLLVGNSKERQYFENYFSEIELVGSNSEALSRYHQNSFFTIFLDSDSKKDSAFDICKRIRANDKQTVIAILAEVLDKEKLQKALPLHLSGCIEKPFNKNQVEDVLCNVHNDLEFLSSDTIRFKNGYHFCTKQQILYGSFHEEIKLTKNELKLLNLLIKAKELITEETIGYEIWEEDSFELDLSNRLKNLLYNLRRKLPKDSISNSYKLGYKLILP
jgi:DNA-binding response OmpR family regulator